MAHFDIIDNDKVKLAEEIKNRLGGADAVKFATGYLYLSGFYEIADQLGNLEEAKILVGDTLNRQTVEALAQSLRSEEALESAVRAGTFERPDQRHARANRVADGIRANVAGLPHSTQREQRLAHMARLIQEGKIQIRVYTRYPLHAKAYVFKFKPQVAQGAAADGLGIIGSSNLTLSGFRRNTELNTYVRGQKNYEELNAWFDRLWEEAVPFEETLKETLEESWALRTVEPYDIYILTLYHLVASSLQQQTEQIWFWTDDAYMDCLRRRFDGFEDLYDFQKVAIMHATNTLSRYNGVFISDVVGLGKTFIGSGLLKQLGQRAVILCPASLQTMWKTFTEKFEVDAQVISQGMLYHGTYDENSVLYPYEDRPVVLIDESHNFRNDDTKRYEEVQPFLAGKKVILMTATPQNTSVWNIYNQIKLFHQTERNIFPVEGGNLYNLFKRVEAGDFRLQALLKYVLIRRTRAHIKAYYQREGEKLLTFPRRQIDTVGYNIDDIYDNLYDRILALLQQLTYARYNLWQYVLPAKQEVDPYVDLKRVMGTLKVFHKIRLFRRLESSIAAFRQSIANLLRVHRRFLTIIEEQQIVPAGEELQDRIYRYDAVQLADYLETMEDEQPYQTQDFDTGALTRDLSVDIAVFEEIQRHLQRIPEDDDPKYDELRRQIENLQEDTPKVLIFSEFADTVEYLHKRLRDDFRRVGYATGDVKGSLLETIGAFAPRANQYRGDRRIDILVATDVLSEGHNLQDCSAIINYDLHWNPVRLIQRAGRVDRIGSEAEIIWVRNFLPVERVEEEINIQETLRERIAEIHRYIGEDTQILERDEQLNEDAMYTIYDKRDLDELEESESIDFSFDEAQNLIRQLEDSEPNYMRVIRNMQLGLRSAKAADELKGVYAFFRQGDFPKLFIRRPDGTIIDDFSAIIRNIHCAPDCPELDVSEAQKASYYESLTRLKAHFQQLLAQDEIKGRLPAEVRKTKRRLEQCVRALDGEELQSNAAKIDRVLTEYFPQQLLAELRRLNARDLSEREYFNQLVEFYNRHNLGTLMQREEQETEPTKAPIEFVCGEILV
jgi:superfamily II DNA or RNA helicase